MQLRPRTWFFISATLFVTSYIFWRMGEERAGRLPGANPAAVSSPATNNSQPISPSTGQPPSAQRPQSTNEVPYRLANTSLSPEQLNRKPTAILFQNALIDTAVPQAPSVPLHLKAPADHNSFVVQSKKEITEKFKRMLESEGAKIISYVPHNAYLVRVSPQTASRLSNFPEVQSVSPFEPYYKVATDLIAFAADQKPLNPAGPLRLTLFPGQKEIAADSIKSMGLTIIGEDKSPFGPELIVFPDPESLPLLAQLDSVQTIEKFHPRLLHTDFAKERVGVSTLGAPTNWLNLNGQGILVNVNDYQAVDNAHPDLVGRVYLESLTEAVNPPGDPDGHATHVAGIIASSGASFNGSRSTNFVSSTNENYRGLAPAAEILSLDFGLFSDFELQHRAAQSNYVTLARTNWLVSNNSWGYGIAHYNSSAASFDAATRDAVPEMTGSQGVLYVFSAGNDGGGTDAGFGGTPPSINSPATAKNVLTVGAIESARYVSNSIYRPDAFCIYGTNQEFFVHTDSSNQVWAGSARGNVGIGFEGEYGRFKPDVVAPGTFIISTRSTQWDEATYYSNTNIFRTRMTNIALGPMSTNRLSIFIPDGECSDTVAWGISLPASGTNGSQLLLYTSEERIPRPSSSQANLVSTNNYYAITNGESRFIQGVDIYYDIVNTNHGFVIYDINTFIVITNDLGNYYNYFNPDPNNPGLAQLNDSLGNNYRFETGTSMAAPVVSGMLALIQERLQRFGMNPSPALMKGMIINSARTVSQNYDYAMKGPVNIQGWGLPNIQRILPLGDDPAQWPIKFVDQSHTNALATGENHNYSLTFSPGTFTGTNSTGSTNMTSPTNFPIRITLVWTDPPGNPAVGVKLVNDLDLVVTNLSNGEVYFGNNFRPSTDFTDVNIIQTTNNPGGTNSVRVINAERDFVNNVENVYLNAPLGSNYAIGVFARRVNVNAVTAHTNGIVQDYALVVSHGNLTYTNPFSITQTAATFTNVQFVTVLTNTVGTNGYGGTLLNQRVGANSPLLLSTNGVTNQWNFYVLTNSSNFPNVAFATFIPPNLSRPRSVEADIDLYVSTDPSFLQLNPAAVAAADKSLSRRGTELVVYTNNPADVFYVGVKSEDQQGAEFGFFGVASESPFSKRNEDGSITIEALPVPQQIPDGSPDRPGGVYMFAVNTEQDEIRQVIVGNPAYNPAAGFTVMHELFGDLIATLTFQAKFAVLHNHSFPASDYFGGIVTNRYDDLPDAAPGHRGIDGPGSLRDFIGMQAAGLWTLNVQDSALTHTGSVGGLTLTIYPAPPTNLVDFIAIIPAQSTFYHYVDVPDDATNFSMTVSHDGTSSGTIELMVRTGDYPTLATNDLLVSGPGPVILNLSSNTVPPLEPGERYFYGIRNPNQSEIRVRVQIRVGRDVQPDRIVRGEIPRGSIPILDDATTNSTIFISSTNKINSINVGVTIAHERVSDLVLHLVSPSGDRFLLFENRGGTDTNGLGKFGPSTVITNVIASPVSTSFEGSIGQFDSGQTTDGWTVLSGSVEVRRTVRPFPGPNTGVNALYTTGDPNVGGTLYRNLNTISGATYRVSFYFAKTNDVPTNSIPAGLQVSAGTNVITNFTATAPIPWTRVSSEFVARTNNTVLLIGSNPAASDNESGIWLDTFLVEQFQVETNMNFTVFTENTNLTRTPIKFADPPFNNTNASYANTLISGFEVARRTYTSNEDVDGWTVVSNTVTVTNSTLPNEGLQHLSMEKGAIRRSIDTIPGREYILTFYGFAGVPPLPEFFNTGVDSNHVILQHNFLDPHYLLTENPSALTARRPGNTNFNPNWHNLSNNTDSLWIAPPGNLNGGSPKGFRTSLDLTGYNPATTVLEGQWSVATERGINIVINLTNRTGITTPIRTPQLGFREWYDFSITNFWRKGTNYLDFIAQTPGSTPALRVRLKSLEVQEAPGEAMLGVNGESNVVFLAPNVWSAVTHRFVAQSSNTVISLASLETNRITAVDAFQIRETGNTFYLPEESLSPLVGENPFGTWTLEIWDNRVGGPITGALEAWKLDITVAPPRAPRQPRTSPTMTPPAVSPSAQSTRLTFSSTPGTHYQLEVSEDLVNWDELTVITATDNQTTVEDPDPARNNKARFYRLRETTAPVYE